MATTPETASRIQILRTAAERAWRVIDDGDHALHRMGPMGLWHFEIGKIAEDPDADEDALALLRDYRLYGVALTAKHAVELADGAIARLRPILEQMYGPMRVEELLPSAMRALAQWDGTRTPTGAVETACGSVSFETGSSDAVTTRGRRRRTAADCREIAHDVSMGAASLRNTTGKGAALSITRKMLARAMAVSEDTLKRYHDRCKDVAQALREALAENY